jgi:hypothetical protein
MQVKHALLIACVAILAFFPVQGSAQSQATLVGSVTDPTGATVPGADVTVSNLETGVERVVQTNEVGNFRVFPLNPGAYTVMAATSGFKTQIRDGVVLQVSEIVEVDFVMELGEVTETIEVTGAAPIMQTQEASVGNVVNTRDLERLPVNQRNFTRLILLMPGTSSRRRSQSRGTRESGTQLFSVNGSRPQDNNYVLDNVDSNMQMMNSPGISPPMDAIQEFKIATNTGSEFARSAGANVNMVIKSGTRELHGTVYEYFRNDELDANEFFFNRTRTADSPTKVPFNLNQYGVAIGGPIPSLSDKMFWFVSWEGFRRRRGSTQTYSTPPADFRAGDFSRVASGVSRPVPGAIIDPLTGEPFPDATIPLTRQNPSIPTIIQLTHPSQPNRAGDTNNFIGNRSQANDRDQLHWRWDYNVNSKDTVYFRFSNQNADLISPSSNPNFSANREFDVFNYGGTWNHIFGPTTVLQMTFGTNQPNNPGVGRHLGGLTRGDFIDQAGLQMYQREVFGEPFVSMGFGAYNAGGGAGGSVTGDEIYQASGTLSTVFGRHSLKVGGQYHWRRFYTNTSNPMNGNGTFNGQLSGFPMADALLGYPSLIRRGQGNTLTNGIGHFLIGFVQDDWRVSQKLTVNLGMMYQFGSRPYDTTDRLGNLWVRRDDSTGEYFGTLLWAAENPQPAPPDGRVPSDLSTFTTGLPANMGGWGRALVGSDRNDIAPRLGVAYQADDKTVVRAGFGIFYNSTFVQELQDLRKFWPFTVQQVFSPNRGGIDLSITDTGPPFSSTAAIGGWPQQPTNRSPYSMQWNFFIQRQVMDDMTLDVGYVGSGSRKQIGYSPFNNALTPGPGAVQPRRLLPSFGDLDGGSNQYNGSYNALQVKLQKRFSDGLQFNLNYSWQKALDGQSSLAEVKVQDPFNRDLDYSRSSWDTRQVFNFSYVYELPFGKGRKFGRDMSSAADAIVGGWALEGITRLETGPPLNIQLGQDIANTGRSRQRPNLVGNPNSGPKTPDAWFNASAFEVPNDFTFGTAGAYITDADGIVSFDVSLAKTFRMTESQRLELRVEFFNLPNHVNFNLPQERMNRGNFNKITSQSTNPRQIQLALRYSF